MYSNNFVTGFVLQKFPPCLAGMVRYGVLLPVFFVFFVIAPFFFTCKASSDVFTATLFSQVEFHVKRPLGVYFRVGQDITFRKYDRIVSEGGFEVAANFAVNALIFQAVRASISSVSSQWLGSPVTRDLAGVISALLFPTLINRLYSWITGQRTGSEQIKIADPDIARRFYIELIYGQTNSDQRITITPFPGGAPADHSHLSTISDNFHAASVAPWQYLHRAAVNRNIKSVDLSWHQQNSNHSIHVQLTYYDRPPITANLSVTDSESLPESIESLLHHQMQGQNNHTTSLLSQAIIERVIAIVEEPESAPLPIAAAELINTLSVDDQGYVSTLSLCGAQNYTCDEYLQLL